jgi:hypothetical protein
MTVRRLASNAMRERSLGVLWEVMSLVNEASLAEVASSSMRLDDRVDQRPSPRPCRHPEQRSCVMRMRSSAATNASRPRPASPGVAQAAHMRITGGRSRRRRHLSSQSGKSQSTRSATRSTSSAEAAQRRSDAAAEAVVASKLIDLIGWTAGCGHNCAAAVRIGALAGSILAAVGHGTRTVSLRQCGRSHAILRTRRAYEAGGPCRTSARQCQSEVEAIWS